MGIDLQVLKARPQQTLEALPFKQWHFPDGALWTNFYRTGTDFLLRFPDLADYQISADAQQVCCWPALGISEHTIQHLYLNQVLPLAQSKQGKQVFHASAIETPVGVVAFMAESGRGKSTLAASFATNGYRFLTDDSLLLEASDKGYNVLPSHPSIRLWDDSKDALIAITTPQAPPVQYTPKARMLFGDSVAFCTEAQPLRRVYFLGDGIAASPIFQRIPASAALINLVKNTFLLDTDSQQALATHFEQLTQMVALPIYYALDYPRRYDDLAQVRQAILAHVMLQE